MFNFPPVLKGMMYATSGIGIVSNLVLGYAFLFKYPYIKAMQDNRQGLHRVILDIDKADAYNTRGTYQGSTYYVRATGQPQAQAPRVRVKAQKSSKVRSRKEKRTVAAREENSMVAPSRHQHQQHDDTAVRNVGYKARAVPPAPTPIQEAVVSTPPPRLRQEAAPIVREPTEGEVRSRSLRKVAD